MPDTTANSTVISSPPAYFGEALTDAESLLKYAAESGMSIDDATRNYVLQARSASSSGWTEESAANLITALATLAVLAKPVTARSLHASQKETRPTARSYLITAIRLAVLIVPFSVASFLVSAISTTVRSDITLANDLAVKLDTQTHLPRPTVPAITPAEPTPNSKGSQVAAPTTKLAPPAPSAFVPCHVSATSTLPPTLPPGVDQTEVITELQTYASTIRSIDSRSRQLNALVLWAEGDPCKGIRGNPFALHEVFELPAGLPNLPQAAQDRTAVYQEVRYFAQSLLEDTSFYYGAMTSCILPALYALLGTCAFLLRNFEQQMSTLTFIPSHANSARFLIAGIGGAVVGLFNNFAITQGASLSPLAVAFLVGYGVDVFFTFLDGFLQTFTRNTATRPAKSEARKAG